MKTSLYLDKFSEVHILNLCPNKIFTAAKYSEEVVSRPQFVPIFLITPN